MVKKRCSWLQEYPGPGASSPFLCWGDIILGFHGNRSDLKKNFHRTHRFFNNKALDDSY